MGMINISSKLLILAIVTSFFTGFFISNFKTKNSPIVWYISQEEISALEDQRISLIQNPQEKQKFFGRIKDAGNMIEEYLENKKSKDGIIVLSSGKVYGDNVKSLSNEVFEYIIRGLASK
jgi:hypothetical protein